MTSRYLNVDEHGIRQNRLPPRPIAAIRDAVWFFGGSTTFGEGVADSETIPARLEALIGRPVVNFGVRNYSSLRENLLLGHYLRLGYRPQLVLFLDGINETCGPEFYREEMAAFFEMAQDGSRIEIGRSLFHAYARVQKKLGRVFGPRDTRRGTPGHECSASGARNDLGTLVKQQLSERAALCTFVQPFATVHGPASGFTPDFLASPDARELYELYAHLEPAWRAAGATFLTDALDGYPGHPFVDEVHYSADASRVLAATMAQRLVPLLQDRK
jgi:hypothetical protein